MNPEEKSTLDKAAHLMRTLGVPYKIEGGKLDIRVDSQSSAKIAWEQGKKCLNSGEKSEALDHFENAIHCEPGFANAWGDKARTLQGLGRIEQALVCYDEAIRLEPNNGLFWFNKATLIMNEHRLISTEFPSDIAHYDQAIHCLQQALSNGYDKAGTLLDVLKPFKMLAELFKTPCGK